MLSAADDIFASFSSAAGLLVAASGGPDSLALLALAAHWSKGPSRPPVFAATFDHALRPGSRDEAELCARVAARLGVPHAILTWEGDKPSARIQERARAARYRALVAHARELGADVLLTGHHADDQAETILFRLLRGSGVGGLAGMKALRPRAGLLHARPLLDRRKAELVAFCAAQNLPFLRDPSNADPRFARTRMRALAVALEAEGLGPDGFARLARRAARAEEALAQAAAALAGDIVLSRTEGRSEIDGARLAAAAEELALRVLLAEIARIGAQPRLERAEPLIAQLCAAARAGHAFKRTLGRAIVDLRPNGRLILQAEGPRRRIAQALPQDAG